MKFNLTELWNIWQKKYLGEKELSKRHLYWLDEWMNAKKNKNKKNERTLKLWTKKYEWNWLERNLNEKEKRKIKTKPKQSYRQNERLGSTENDKGWRKDEHYVQ